MTMIHDQFSLFEALGAEGPAPDRSPQVMLRTVCRVMGRKSRVLGLRRPRHETSSEVHFGWVLEGRAVQDVWISSSRRTRKAAERDLMYGTTLRVYDPRSDLWHITWIDPVRQVLNRMTRRKVGDDIVQGYASGEGKRCQWLVTEISADSFHWISRESADDGETWTVRGEFFLRRRVADRPGSR